MGSYEWIILLLGFLGLLIWEWTRVRRDIRQAKAAELNPAAAPGTATSPAPRDA